jgi:hypothetical protein
MTNMDVGAPMPVSIGRCADLYSEVRELRLAMDKEVAVIKARETEIREHIINSLSKSDDTGAAGLKYRAQIVIKVAAKIEDWGVFTSWIRKHDRFDLLHKRINETAIKDLWAERETVPGVEKINVPDVSITKL